MLARAHTFTIDGPQARHVTVELDVRAGLPAFTIVGLADAAVREARERIQTAIRNSGFEFPARRITANLAPGDLPQGRPGSGPGARLRGARRQRPAARRAPGARGAVRRARPRRRACARRSGTLAVAQTAARARARATLARAAADAHARRRWSTGSASRRRATWQRRCALLARRRRRPLPAPRSDDCRERDESPRTRPRRGARPAPRPCRRS